MKKLCWSGCAMWTSRTLLKYGMAGAGGLAAPATRSMRNNEIVNLMLCWPSFLFFFTSRARSASFCVFLGVSGGVEKLQPVALINKRNCQQQHAEHNEADDAIAAIELGDVVDEYFHDRGGDEQESLPANKSRAPEKSDHHQHGAVSHPQGGVRKVALALDAA